MNKSKGLLASLAKGALLPQEEMLEVRRKKGKLFIGIPKEISFQENRVALVPDAVALLVNDGHEVLVGPMPVKWPTFRTTTTAKPVPRSP
jgi:alanine dehydrogenase